VQTVGNKEGNNGRTTCKVRNREHDIDMSCHTKDRNNKLDTVRNLYEDIDLFLLTVGIII
jgi:hypothetical protein